MTPKIFVSRPLQSTVLDAARRIGTVDVRVETEPMTLAETQAALAGYDAVLPTLGDPLSAAAFSGSVRCKLLANFGVGYNHIDVAAARAAGVAVTNTPGSVTDATADIAVMLMLMAARGASAAEQVLRQGTWQGWHPTQFLGHQVTGKTLGIVGMGAIGQATARRCHFGFGMDVVFYNRSVVTDCGVPGAKQLNSVAEVAAVADFLSLHVPGGPATQHLIDKDVLAQMKPNSFLINTARGNVVDEAALAAALLARQIAGAGLDVYEHEPRVTSALLDMPNVTLLPHLGTAAHSVRENMGMMAVDNLRAFFANEPLPNPVSS